MAVREDVESNM